MRAAILHTNSHLWNLWACERKIRPHFNALIIGDNNSSFLRSRAPDRCFQEDIYEKKGHLCGNVIYVAASKTPRLVMTGLILVLGITAE